jgi:FkbM family methyltransferase
MAVQRGTCNLNEARRVLDSYNSWSGEKRPHDLGRLETRPHGTVQETGDLKIISEICKKTNAVYTKREPFRCRKGDRVLDCGANIGASAHRFTVDGASHVTCVEPGNGVLPQLRRNVGNCSQVSIEPLAISRTSGSLTFHDHDATRAGPSRSCLEEHDGYTGSFANGVKPYPVTSVPLDAMIKDHTVLKIDIEGADFDAFEGLPHGYDFEQIRVIMLETSSARSRKQGKSWRGLYRVFKKARKAGFEYAQVPAALFKAKHWSTATAGKFIKGRDDMVYLYKPRADRDPGNVHFTPKKRKKLVAWKRFKKILTAEAEADAAFEIFWRECMEE